MRSALAATVVIVDRPLLVRVALSAFADASERIKRRSFCCQAEAAVSTAGLQDSRFRRGVAFEVEFADARSGIIETMDIRLGGICDAAAIAFVQVQSWKAIYRELVPQGDLDRLALGHRCCVWDAVLRASNWQDRTGTLLAESDKGVVGFVSIGATRDGGATRVAAVRALHLLEDAWDTTAGKQLVAAALDSLSQTRFEQVVVCVLEADKRARDLYEVSGWREDGAARVRDQQAFAVRLAEVRYRHALR